MYKITKKDSTQPNKANQKNAKFRSEDKKCPYYILLYKKIKALIFL